MAGEGGDTLQRKGNRIFIDVISKNSAPEERNVGREARGGEEDRAQALQLVSRYAAMSGLTAPEYCEYCWKVELTQEGMEEKEAGEKARRHVADCMEGGEQEAAYDIVLRYAMKSKLTVAQYLDFCKRNGKNDSAYPCWGST